MKILHLNSRSIINKIDECRLMVNLLSPHILCVSESWLKPDISDIEIEINGYNSYRKDRIGRTGGGILVYIKKELIVDQIETEMNELDLIQLNIKYIKSKPFRLIAYYRPSSTTSTTDEKFLIT